ncbi:MAG: HAMP domain-containing histidine kinase [Saccharofermentans sp.]|nr:HAMP domain-containing histidine kinase [Saccharofermentans sp.]
MAKSKKPGGSLRRYILSRFFLVLAIVSIVEIIVANIANTYLLPILFSLSQYNNVIKINGAEGLFIIIFVLVVTSVVNKISPILKVSPVEVNQFFENILINRGFYGTDAEEAARMFHALSEDPKGLLPFIASMAIIALVLFLPYIIGGVIFAVSVAKHIRRIEREKETQRKNEERRRYLMISDIVHDLKTPMTTVYGYAKALNDGIVPSNKQAEYLDAIMAKTERTNEVISLLLDYVKLDSEGFKINRARIDVCELVRSCCAFCYTDIESSEDEIDIDVPEKSLYIKADSVQLSRVITNLITNAIRHNEKGTKIGIFIKCENPSIGEDVRVLVADTGEKIPDELKDSIFEPFVTSDASRSTSGGTGLGLPLSVKICDMHGFGLKLVQAPEIKRYNLGDEYKKVFVITM